MSIDGSRSDDERLSLEQFFLTDHQKERMLLFNSQNFKTHVNKRQTRRWTCGMICMWTKTESKPSLFNKWPDSCQL